MTSYFPSNPTVGQLYENYTWTGQVWKRLGSNVNTGPDFIENNLIDVNYIPPSVARIESPTFTGTVNMPSTTNIGDVSHTEIQNLNGVTSTIQTQIDAKQSKVTGVSDAEIGYLDGVTGNIQTQIDGKTTASYVDNAVSTAVANVIDTAPSTLDTLNELAAALGDDPNFATTITNAIAAKLTSVPGIINQYAGPSAPTGWLMCEGQEVLITTYQSLYNAITSSGTTFPYGANTNGSGGAGSTHFRIPNLKGRVPVGRDSAQTEFDLLGEAGGSKTSVASHTHGINHDHAAFTSGDDSPDHSHLEYYGNWVNAGVFGNQVGVWAAEKYTRTATSGANVRHQHSIDVPNFTGNSGPASAEATSGNLQPYIVVNYIIKH